MKKMFEEPIFQVINYPTEDVLTESGGDPLCTDPGYSEGSEGELIFPDL